MGKIVSLAWLPREFIRERVCTKILAKLREKAKRNDGKLGKLKKKDARKENEKEQRGCSGYSATSLRAFLANVFLRQGVLVLTGKTTELQSTPCHLVVAQNHREHRFQPPSWPSINIHSFGKDKYSYGVMGLRLENGYSTPRNQAACISHVACATHAVTSCFPT